MTRRGPAMPHAGSDGAGVPEAAKRLGVAPATLRIWALRYGLGASAGTTSDPQYTADDFARLEVMRRLTLDGVAPVDAARAALGEGAESEGAENTVDGAAADAKTVGSPGIEPAPAGQDAAGQAAAERPAAGPGLSNDDNSAADDDGPADASPLAVPVPLTKPTQLGAAAVDKTQPQQRPMLRAIPGGEQGFGQSRPRSTDGKIETRVVGIVDTALRYDQAACNELLKFAAGENPVDWWTKDVEPAWGRIAERTVLGTPGEAPEMVLASAALGALRDFTREYEASQVAVGNPPVNHPSRMRKLVLIFAPVDEDIPLAAHALAAALVSAGATARVVTGPASPHRAVELVTMVRPAALVLATSLARPDLGIVAAVHNAFPSLPLLVSMQHDDGLPDLPLAASVQRVRSFAALVHEVLAIVE